MSANELLQQAYQSIRSGNRQEAVQILMPVLKADQSNADAWWLLANAVTDPSQQRRALNEVLKLRPGDERASRMLGSLAPTESFADLGSSFGSAPPPAARAPQQSPINDPFAGSDNPFGEGEDPFAPGRQPQPARQPVYTQPTAGGYPVAPGNVPPAPVYMGQPRRRGPSCCLLSGCLVVLLFCMAPLLCVGAGVAGISPVFDQMARTMGAPSFQGILDIVSGQLTPLPGSMIDDIFSQVGVSNFGDLQSTMQGSFDQLATLAGTPGAPGSNSTGERFSGSPVAQGNIEAGQTLTGRLQPRSVGDAYALNATAGTTYTIDAVGAEGVDLTLTIINADGLVTDSDDDSGSGFNARIEFTPAAAGKYTIVVGTYADNGGDYTLSVTR